jgi:alpha,alpha-trehalase
MTIGRAQTAASSGRPDAALFDMDGVVTDTASAHAAAWKRLFDEYLRRRAQRSGGEFTAFDIDGDFREYVDGKPRYDGVKSFLESRGIELPFGDPGDGPDTETVCGLGNRKNRYFHAWLAENRVRTYPSTINLLRALRDAGIRTGMFASSRNGAAVLENAGIGELFDIKLDGVDLSELGMRGKPDPAMLFESAARLDAVPARTAIVEDAISGVQAGSAGGFAPVIGVNRDDYGDALIARGEATKELMASDR